MPSNIQTRESPAMYEELIQGCKQQKPQSQRELYERFAAKMLGVCYRYAHSREEAEDMMQEGFIKVFQNISKFDDKGSLEGWIRRLMINNAIDFLRKQKHYKQQLEINEAITEEVSEDALDQLEVEFLYRVIQAMPAGYRAIFNLYAIEGYSHAEIAAQLDISESTSRSQYTRARAMLKKRISEAYLETKVYRDVC